MSSRKSSVRFLQLSDLHLDSPFSYLPNAEAQQMQAELRDVFSRAMNLAIKENVDVVLLPGDLFEYENVRSGTISFLAKELTRVAPVPCFIIPGNHDYYGPKSWYAQRGRDRLELGEPEWPENVFIYESQEFVTIDTYDSFTVTGHAHLGFDSSGASLAGLNPPSDERIHFLMLHGSRTGNVPPGKQITFPFVDDDLLARGFSFAALGHYHSFATIPEADEDELPNCPVRAAYAGCPAGRNFRETGPKYIITGEARNDGAILQRHSLASRRCEVVRIDGSGIDTSADLVDQAAKQIAECCREEDLIRLVIHGQRNRNLSLDSEVLEQLDQMAFHIQLIDESVPNFDLDELAKMTQTTVGRFVVEMRSHIDAAQNEQDEEIYRAALYHGLDAFFGRDIGRRIGAHQTD
ncbi:MAG: exonuclease SbcCD subunit D [Anaerolineales bacterium]